MAGTTARTIGMRKITKVVAAAATPEPISPTTLYVTDFEIYPLDSNAGAVVYIGDSTVDSTWIPRAKGEPYNFVHGTGNFLGNMPVVGFDLNKIFIAASANGDTVTIQYFAGDKG